MSLIDKRICVNKRTKNWHYKELDVAEAVRELKARNTITHEIDIDDIDEIFGEKLIVEAGA